MALATEKKGRAVVTIQQKWGFVEALLGSGIDVVEFWKDRARIGQALDWQRLSDWKVQYAKEDWSTFLDACSGKEMDGVKKVPNWWRVLMNARAARC